MIIPLLLLLLFSTCFSAMLPLINVDPETGFFVDPFNRVRLFHGVNAVYKQPPFFPNTDAFDPQLSLCAKDVQDLYDWGFNVVRLGVMWVGWEPLQNQVNTTFVSKMQEIVSLLATKDIYSIVDMHQDVMNRRFCGEGFPDWAVGYPYAGVTPSFPFPVAGLTTHYPVSPPNYYPDLKTCLSHFFAEYYVAQDVAEAFQRLYDNKNQFQDHFVNFWSSVAQNFATNDNVLGYELINEPFFGDVWRHPWWLVDGGSDLANLAPMYERINDAIRQHDARHNVFFEKSMGNYIDVAAGFKSVPGGANYRNRSVYSFHEYCNPGDDQGTPKYKELCQVEETVWLEFGVADTKRFGCAGFLTEFGAVTNSTKGIELAIGLDTDAADRNLLSWTYWQFKAFKDLTTSGGYFESFYNEDGQLEWNKVSALSRTYAQAIAGNPTAMFYNSTSKQFDLTFVPRTNVLSNATEIYLNEKLHYPNGFTVTLDPPGVATWTHVAPNRIVVMHQPTFKKLAVRITRK